MSKPCLCPGNAVPVGNGGAAWKVLIWVLGDPSLGWAVAPVALQRHSHWCRCEISICCCVQSLCEGQLPSSALMPGGAALFLLLGTRRQQLATHFWVVSAYIEEQSIIALVQSWLW